jgi:hypothetical protein
MRTLIMLAFVAQACIPCGLLAQGRGGEYRGGGYRGGSTGAVVAQPQGALGGSYAGQGMSRPLGGIAPPSYPVGVRPPSSLPPRDGGRGNRSGYRYSGPVYYVPNAFGPTFSDVDSEQPGNSAYGPGQSGPVRGAGGIQFSDAVPVPQPQTVIVNQYYGKDEAPLNSGIRTPVAPGEPAPTSDYYLIAYKNRHVITALAYWVDGETLHYVTAANVHNQSSLNLIDLDLTTRLNADREVPFSVTGR